jgi:Tfp pilus assembly protein PilX
MHRNRHPFPSRPRKGFALLITITLLAFLVLLLVSLASLTRVETQVAANNQQLAQARQNALMAMNIALGRLQQLAGPDQRVTGTADLIAGRDTKKKNWTGIWDTRTATSGTLLGWLVSGTTATGTTGVTSALSAAAGNSLVDLVGINTNGTNNDVDNVKVETQPVKATGVPGLDPATAYTVGNFAYWVGDEGVKAKVSLTDPWESPSQALKTATGISDATAAIYRFVGAHRNGIEGVSSTGVDTATTDKLDTAYPATDSTFKSALPKVMSRGQLALANSAGQAALNSAAKARFHDLTASSFSVMSNVADGGLKKDLTTWLRSPASGTNLPLDSSLIADPTPDAAPSLPKWGIIRSYANLSAGAPIPPRVQTDVQQGIFPTVSYCRLGFDVSCAGDGQPLLFHFFPVVVLWNPYNVPIDANQYEINFDYVNSQAVIQLIRDAGYADHVAAENSLVGNASATPAIAAIPAVAKIWLYNQKLAPEAAFSAYKPFKFPLDAPQIPPGQSLVFTLNNSGTYASGTNKLSPNSTPKIDNSVTVLGPAMTAADLPPNKVWLSNSSSNLSVTLSSGGQTLQNLENIGSTSIFRSSPVSTAVEIKTFTVAPRLFMRVEYYMSEGTHGNSGLTPRWLAQLNPAAPAIIRKPRSLTLQAGQNNVSVYFDIQGSMATPTLPTNRASMGSGEDVSAIGTPTDLVLKEFQPAGVPLFSLAQLQHATLSLLNLYPAYAVGNSQTSFYVDPTLDRLDLPQSAWIGVATTTGSPNPSVSLPLTKLYDLSYILNKALWDKYYFSTIPSSLTSATSITADYYLPNARHSFYWRASPTANGDVEFNELKTGDGAAAHLLVNGGFNVNSTSVQAWRALLYAHNNAPSPSASTPALTSDYKHPFSRYTNSPDGSSNTNVWRGYRVLSDKQLDYLAAKIVAEVKARGPFISMSDFVNRRLKNDATGLKGTLQAAIDAVDADISATAPADPADRINTRAPFNSATSRIVQTPASSRISTDPYKVYSDNWVGNLAPTATPTPATYTYNATTIGTATVPVTQPNYGTTLDLPSSSRAAFAPGFLTQADLLTSLGPVLTARSDTFVIRAYGDVQNPTTSAVEAKAWCEAIVQRLPDYVETTVNPWATPAAASASGIFGRRFKVISFRWLSASDI